MTDNFLRDEELAERFGKVVANLDHPSILPRVRLIGYSDTDLSADRDLLGRLQEYQAVEKGDQEGGTVTEEDAEQAVRRAFRILQRIIHLADRRRTDVTLADDLDVGPLPKSGEEFLSYADELLNRIADSSQAQKAVEAFGVTPARRDELRGLVTELQEEPEDHQTLAYRGVMEEARLSYAMLVSAARDALKDSPELLETLGMEKV